MSKLARLHAADAAALAWVARRRGRTLTKFMREITRTGDATVVVVGMSVILAAWPGWTTALVAGAAALGLALFSLFKRVANRARPDGVIAVLAAPDRFSMPSGHATCAFAIAVSAMVLAPSVGAPLLLWASLVASSRVVLGVHYPFDVLAGVLLGAGSAALVTGVFLVIPTGAAPPPRCARTPARRRYAAVSWSAEANLWVYSAHKLGTSAALVPSPGSSW